MGAKIMAKYGYKNGEGLGRENQGLTTALSFVRTSGSRGVIVNKDEAEGPKEVLKSEMCPIGGKVKKKSTASQPFPILQKKDVKSSVVQGNPFGDLQSTATSQSFPSLQKKDAKNSVVHGNPVGELQELCHSKKWPDPNYEQ